MAYFSVHDVLAINNYTLHQMEALPLSKVIELAGPKTKDYTRRMAAAFVLEFSTVKDTHLKDLYWLSITALHDASGEYLSAIYDAIYRAETAKRMRQPHNNAVGPYRE